MKAVINPAWVLIIIIEDPLKTIVIRAMYRSLNAVGLTGSREHPTPRIPLQRAPLALFGLEGDHRLL